MTLLSAPQSVNYVFKTKIIRYKPTDDKTTGSHAVQPAQIFSLRAPSSFCCVAWRVLRAGHHPLTWEMIVYWHFNHVQTPISQSIRNLPTSGLKPKSWKLLENLFSQHFQRATSHWLQWAPQPDTTQHRRTVTDPQPDTHQSTISHEAQVFTNLFICCVCRSWQPTTRSVLPQYQQLLQEYNCIFDPKITGWNGVAGPIQATVNIGPM